jgi:hypothetical protein
MMWKNKNPPNTVFMDKNPWTPRPPDVVAVWEKLPFRDNIFETIIFDPPHKLGRTTGRGMWATPTNPSYYGIDISKRDFRTGVYHGTREFLRVAKRLCFKWNDIELTLERVLSLFPKDWKEVHRKVIRKGLKTRTLSYWITFVQSSKESANE